MSLFIYPYGNFGSKLMSLIGAINLEKEINKKINICYSLQYDDLLFDKNIFMEDLPNFDFKNIEYSYFSKKNNRNSLLLNSLFNYVYVIEYMKEYSKKHNLELIKYNIQDNKYPLTKKGIIYNSWIFGFKSNGALILKKWLSDVTKFKIYKTFIKDIGFDWHSDLYEYVGINIDIGFSINTFFNSTNAFHFILNPDFYQEALKIIKKKSKKPLKIIVIHNLDVNLNLLFKYVEVFKKFGEIIDINNIISQSYQLILFSKMNHFIGSGSTMQIFAYLYSKKNSCVIINSNNVTKYKYNKKDYPKHWIFLNDNKYRISTIRDLYRYNLDVLYNIKTISKKEMYEFSKINIALHKPKIYELYKNTYVNFNKEINSIFLKNLLLYRVLFHKNNYYLLNSNINLKEGLLLYNLIKKYKPKKLLEIGLACGISSSFMLCSMDKKSKLYSIDPYQKIVWNKFGLIVIDEIIKENNLPNNIHTWIPTFSKIYFDNYNNKNDYDLIFIDGDHSYEGTLIDLLGANKLLKKGGILVIDDVLHKDVKNALSFFFKKQNDKNNKNNNIKYKLIDDVKTMNAYIKLS